MLFHGSLRPPSRLTSPSTTVGFVRVHACRFTSPRRIRAWSCSVRPAARERVGDGDVHVLVRVVEPGIASDRDRPSGNRQADADLERLAATVTSMRNLDHDRASFDVGERVIEPARPGSDCILDGGTRIHGTKGDVDWWHMWRVQCRARADTYASSAFPASSTSASRNFMQRGAS